MPAGRVFRQPRVEYRQRPVQPRRNDFDLGTTGIATPLDVAHQPGSAYDRAQRHALVSKRVRQRYVTRTFSELSGPAVNVTATEATGTGAANTAQGTVKPNLAYVASIGWGTSRSTGVTAAASTGVTVLKPVSLADGDVMYAFVSKTTYADTNPFTCSGWTDISPATTGTTTNNDRHLTILRRVVTNAAGEPSDYTFVSTSGTSSQIVGLIARITGASTTTPEDVTVPDYVFTENDATPLSVDATPATDNTLVLQYCQLSLATTAAKTWGPPDGYTNGVNAAAQTGSLDNQSGVAYKTQNPASSVGTNPWLHTADDATTEALTAAVVVRPANLVGLGVGSGAGTATGTTGSLKVTGGLASGSGTANNATATTSAATNADAAVASGAGAANNAQSSIAATSGSSAGAGTGNAAVGNLAVTASAITSAGAANNATVSTSSAAAAGAATGAGAAYDATAATAVVANAGVGLGAGSAFEASAVPPDPNARTITIRDHGHTVTLYHRR